MKKSATLLIFMISSIVCLSQTWEENTYQKNPKATFFDLKESFDNYRKKFLIQKEMDTNHMPEQSIF